MIEFRMPSLGADMEEGTVLEWRVRPGDAVKRGDVVALVDTDKAEIEVEIWHDGTVERLLVPVGEKVPVGAVLAVLRGAGEAAAPSPLPRAAAPQPVARGPEAPPRPTPPRVAPAPPGARVRASPLARRLARDLGVELSTLSGSGPGGEIVRADVEAAARAAPAAERRPPGAAERQAALRRAIAASMERSKREIPHYYLEETVDLRRALQWLAAENQRRPVPERLLLAALLLKATALALRESPELCGTWVGGAFRPASGVHVGVAISLRGGGLLAPTIRDMDRLALPELMAKLRELVARTRRGVLRGSDVSDAAITVTSLGEQGVEKVFGVIQPPQVALVGFGRTLERAWAERGTVGARPTVTATLSADHRASDGVRGARFLAAIARLLGEPEKL